MHRVRIPLKHPSHFLQGGSHREGLNQIDSACECLSSDKKSPELFCQNLNAYKVSLSKIQTISRTLYEHSLRAFPPSREAYRTGLARRRGDAEEVNLVSACALRGSGVTGCGFSQTTAICGNRGICAANTQAVNLQRASSLTLVRRSRVARRRM